MARDIGSVGNGNALACPGLAGVHHRRGRR